jgi:hypothetical protein
MGDNFKYIAVLIGFFFMFANVVGAGSQPPAEGGVLPEFKLSVPENSQLQEYLGVAGKKTFTVSEIKADVVIIEIFSMY